MSVSEDQKGQRDANPEQQVQSQPEVATSRHLTRLPGFWDTNPRGWFVSAEIMFDANKITSDKQKFAHTVLSLSSTQSEKVNYLLLDPPDTDKYNTLKKVLIDRYSISEERKLEEIINKVELGDQKPSDLLHRIKTLAGKDFAVKVVVKLWIRQLPNYIQAALIPQQEKPVEELAKIADQLHDMVSTRTESLGSVSRDMRTPNTELHVLSTAINQLQQQFRQLRDEWKQDKKYSHTQRQNSRSQSPWRRTSSPSRNNQPRATQGSSLQQNTQQQPQYHTPYNWCWYHARFGISASKCQKPCSFHRQQVGPANSGSPNQHCTFNRQQAGPANSGSPNE